MVAIRRPPDAIIFDIQMPGGSGYAVLKQVKSSDKTMRVPVIVLSESIDSTDRAKLKELGADECLSKPVDLDQLLAILSKLLEPPVETPYDQKAHRSSSLMPKDVPIRVPRFCFSVTSEADVPT